MSPPQTGCHPSLFGGGGLLSLGASQILLAVVGGCLLPALLGDLSSAGDITMEGLDKDRQLQTGEIIIIVAVLLMWAGECHQQRSGGAGAKVQSMAHKEDVAQERAEAHW